MCVAVAGAFAYVMRKGVEQFVDYDALDAYINEMFERYYATD